MIALTLREKLLEMHSLDKTSQSFILKRKSCRAYLEKPLDGDILQSLLEVAKWAPSGSNHQPAKVAVLGTETKERLSRQLTNCFDEGAIANPDYDFAPDSWANSYKIRRRACGKAIYQAIGILDKDEQAKQELRRRNYSFFGAPVGLIIYLDQEMPKGSWVDVGIFIQSLLIAADEMGLATCAQASFAEYPDVVREVLSLKEVDIVCGIAIGYEDRAHPLNSFRTSREKLENFTRWYL